MVLQMRRILSCVKSRIANKWVGLSVVHLGDRDVPNGTHDCFFQFEFIVAITVSI